LVRAVRLAKVGVPPRVQHPFAPQLAPPGWPVLEGRDLLAWRGEPWSVLLYGEAGVGKSFAAAEIAWQALGRKTGCLWVRAAQVPAMVFAGSGEIERYQRVSWLFVDDFGRGHAAAAAWEVVAELFYHRYEHERPTVATTNLALELIAKANLPLLDRLREGWLVEVRGESKRDGG